MARPKSLIVNMEWTVVGRAHGCRSNKNHHLQKGQHRLTVKSNGAPHHYCPTCAKTFLVADIKRMQTLLERANGLLLDT